jgi:hypothetical protein
MKLRIILAACAAQLVTLAAYADTDFESPPAEPPAASLVPEQVTGENFHVVDPVQSDGLMHHYVLDSHYGVFAAYGRDALVVRLQEVAALNQIAHTSKANVILASVIRSATPDAPELILLATHPVGSVVGIPVGIVHLLGGYAAETKEFTHRSDRADTTTSDKATSDKATSDKSTSDTSTTDTSTADTSTTPKKKEDKVASDAVRYAQRYLGVTDAERRWYQKLRVDPYTSNEVLRQAVHRLARLDAAASVGMRFASLPRVPYGSQMDRAMDAIYNENPAVLRARRRELLKGYGLSAAEISHFEHALLLNPTRQSILVEIAKSLDGVAGRDELFRHAVTVTSVEEVQVFLRSAALLPALHAQKPLARILPGLRIPAAQRADGHVLLIGAFDSVYWTRDVAGYESALRQALPGDAPREVWLSGAISPRARAELSQRGWEVHDQAAAMLSSK